MFGLKLDVIPKPYIENPNIDKLGMKFEDKFKKFMSCENYSDNLLEITEVQDTVFNKKWDSVPYRISDLRPIDKIQDITSHQPLPPQASYFPYSILIYGFFYSNRIIRSKSTLDLLTEVKMISKFTVNSPISETILETICDGNMKTNDIDDLYQLMKVLHSNTITKDTFTQSKQCDIDNKVISSVSDEENARRFIAEFEEKAALECQRELTHKYADLYKDDNMQSMANVVIDDVMKYLSRHMDKNKRNQNKISGDLVSAGIKKTRKENGYVYGVKSSCGM